MLAWAALLGALGINYRQHRHGRPTLCSTARRHVPGPVFVAGWVGLSGWLLPHYLQAHPLDRAIRLLTH